MAFGARNDDGWRLCHRKGKTIRTIGPRYRAIEVQFTSQAKAKACADELNEQYWQSYWKTESKGKPPENSVVWGMLRIIRDHGGITETQFEEIDRDAA